MLQLLGVRRPERAPHPGQQAPSRRSGSLVDPHSVAPQKRGGVAAGIHRRTRSEASPPNPSDRHSCTLGSHRAKALPHRSSIDAVEPAPLSSPAGKLLDFGFGERRAGCGRRLSKKRLSTASPSGGSCRCAPGGLGLAGLPKHWRAGSESLDDPRPRKFLTLSRLSAAGKPVVPDPSSAPTAADVGVCRLRCCPDFADGSEPRVWHLRLMSQTQSAAQLP